MTTDRKVWLLTQAQYDGALAALCEGLEDGTTADIGADLRVVLHLEHDPDTSISDYDGYGKTEKYAHRYVHGESRTPRPDDFDGSARKIEVAQGYWIWWQPADDMKSFKAWGGTDRELYEKAAREHYEIACRLLRDGFMQLGVELQRKCDADHWHGGVAGVGGVDRGGLRQPKREFHALRHLASSQGGGLAVLAAAVRVRIGWRRIPMAQGDPRCPGSAGGGPTEAGRVG